MCRGKHSVLLLAAFVVSVAAHGSMINPIPRNAVDRNLSMFANGSWPKGDDGCNCADPKGGCVPAAARPAKVPARRWPARSTCARPRSPAPNVPPRALPGPTPEVPPACALKRPTSNRKRRPSLTCGESRSTSTANSRCAPPAQAIAATQQHATQVQEVVRLAARWRLFEGPHIPPEERFTPLPLAVAVQLTIMLQLQCFRDLLW